LNQTETFLLRGKLEAAGYEIVPWGAAASLAIINTCAVTQLAAAKCRQSIRQFIAANPTAFTAVVGCYSRLGAAEIAGIAGVDLLLGNNDKLNVLDYVGDGRKNISPLIVRDRVSREDFSISFAGEAAFDKRAGIKVQDGCGFACSFCVIPRARGGPRSRNFDNLLAEARSLAARGVRELVLTGVNIGLYDSGGRGITDVVDAIASVPGVDRLRIGSIEPTTVPDAILERMADPSHPLLPHLHLPMQSGCDRILRDMRRHYDRDTYAGFVRKAAMRVPGIHIGTDILVGFPGETDAEFSETLAFFESLPFASAHVFSYSERQGTAAAARRDQVPVPVRQQRSIALRRASAARLHQFMEHHLGRVMPVLFEDPAPGHWPGLTDNYLRVIVPAGQAASLDLANKVRPVRLERIQADFIEGSLAG
jgi:threonylcarbamoyladenosine tRNA methylthiotransferase MtaB